MTDTIEELLPVVNKLRKAGICAIPYSSGGGIMTITIYRSPTGWKKDNYVAMLGLKPRLGMDIYNSRYEYSRSIDLKRKGLVEQLRKILRLKRHFKLKDE